MKIKKLLILTVMCVLLCLGLMLNGCSQQASVTVKSQDNIGSFDTSTTIEAVTLVDDTSFSLSADSLTYKNDDACLTVTATNKTDQKIQINTGTLGFSGNYINDYMVTSGYLHLELDPGQTDADEVYFPLKELKLFGINKISEIGLGIRVSYNEPFDSAKGMNYDEIYQDIASIQTSAYGSEESGSASYQDVIGNSVLLATLGTELINFSKEGGFDQNGVAIKSLALIKNKDGDTGLMIEISNSNSSYVNVTASDISINGQMAYEGSWTGDTIVSGKTAVMDIMFNTLIPDEEIENFDLENVENIGVTLGATDADGNTVLPDTQLEFSF